VCTASVCTEEHENLYVNYKLFTVYCQPTIPIAVAEPPTDTEKGSWFSIQSAQAVCAAVAWVNAIRATPAGLVQVRHRDICRIAACRFVGKFQMTNLGYPVRMFSFCCHLVLVISQLQALIDTSGI
jgi:hypothetical protein